ncbi:hypothetical protein CVT24_002636 [Panaeolus cyanescens]|uniref:Fungal-type protein kinase domain-containing protein n=1 Tax=Panaeolus cyanescens TaxID=181874 RepID=A0A409YU64_9AGAR|nr:hypothetical protein CVT24_002636 [Panaeolus cyanescens]
MEKTTYLPDLMATNMPFPTTGAPVSSSRKESKRVERNSAGLNKHTYMDHHIAKHNDLEFLGCTADEFERYYLPFKPSENEMDICVRALKNAKHFDDERERFTHFLRPSCGGNDETKIMPLVEIIASLRHQTLPGRTPNRCTLKSRPDTALKSDIPGANHRIDAWLRELSDIDRPSDEKEIHVSEIAVPMTFKFGCADTDKYQLTIEDDRASIWYFSRSHCVKACSFNFEKEPKRLISVLISLTFATWEELGYDPNVIRHHDGSYIYRLQQTGKEKGFLYFKTITPIFKPQSLGLTGRHTHVWNVEQVTPEDGHRVPGTCVTALKDTWLDSDTMSQSEADIQRNLFHDIRRFAQSDWRCDPRLALDPADQDEDRQRKHSRVLDHLATYLAGDKFKNLFLNIVYDYPGVKLKTVAGGAWDRPNIFDDPSDYDGCPNISSQRCHQPNSTAHPPTQPIPAIRCEPSQPLRKYASKRRYFFVHADVCTPIHKLPTMGDVVDVLKQTVVALWLMFLAGWVHRDVSTGNILALHSSQGWIGKLADLEFAKRFPTTTPESPDLDIGTVYFMPVEIATQTYFTMPAENTNEYDDNYAELPPSASSSSPIQYNPQHDLESVWWILLYFVTICVHHLSSSAYAAQYFGYNATTTRCFLMVSGARQLQTPKFMPELRVFGTRLVRLASRMINLYMKRNENQEAQKPSAYAGTHIYFYNALATLPEDDPDCQWRVIKGTRQGLKRGFKVGITPPSLSRKESECAEGDSGGPNKYTYIGHHIDDHEFLGCTVDEFERYYLPFKPSKNEMDICIEALKNAKHFDDERERFSHFLPREGNNKTNILPLVGMIAVLRKQTLPGRTPNQFSFESRPDTALKSDIPGVNHRIDAFLRDLSERSLSEKDIHLAEIAVPMEFKLGCADTDICQNRRKLLSAAQSIMRDDVRRTWLYGLTIEDDRASMWYFSRSHCVKASSFNVEKEPKRFISVLISLAFATREQLGYDPNVIRHCDGSYVYRLQQTGEGKGFLYFKTITPLFKPQSLRLTGRRTRVWNVEQVAPEEGNGWSRVPGTCVTALKDVWLDSDAMSEAEIQRKLSDDIRLFAKEWRTDPRLALDPPPQNEARQQRHSQVLDHLGTYLAGDKFKDLFLNIIHDYPGVTLKEVAGGAWDRPNIFADPSEEVRYNASPNISLRRHTNSSAPLTQPIRHEPSAPLRKFASKRRYFFVHVDVCTPIDKLPTMGDVVDVLKQTVVALWLMFLAGWVHRDVSTGNILALHSSQGWIGKLADLEFAKRFPTTTPESPDLEIGTVYFMPVEIAMQMHFNAQESVHPSAINTIIFGDNYDECPPSTSSPSRSLIQYNPQHDLESVWWVLLYLVTSCVHHLPSLTYAAKYFGSGHETANRLHLIGFGSPGLFSTFMPQLSAFGILMPLVASSMRQLYMKRNKDQTAQEPGAYANIHFQFYNTLDMLPPQPDWRDIKVGDTIQPPSQPAGQAVHSPMRQPETPVMSDGDEEARPSKRLRADH